MGRKAATLAQILAQPKLARLKQIKKTFGYESFRLSFLWACLTKSWCTQRRGATITVVRGDAPRCSPFDAFMNVRSKRLIGIGVLILLVAIAAGAGLDRWRAAKAEQKQPPPLPQFGSLLPSGDDVEVSGKAMCGFCYWGVGGTSCNVVLKTASAPGIVFLSPNAKVNEIEKITGKCAGGKVEIRARGMLSQYDGHNYLFVRNFEEVAAN